MSRSFHKICSILAKITVSREDVLPVPINDYRRASFLISAADVKQLPTDQGVEIAFAGCSNVGKSSTLNALTNNKQLARTSKTPGRTQLINLFQIDDQHRLVDLPGYGYAKVSAKLRETWQKNMDIYLRERNCLAGIVLVADIRHPLKPFELDMLAWASVANIPLLMLLNKADKLSKSAAMRTLQEVQKTVDAYNGNIVLLPFSAQKKVGLEDLCAILDQWCRW